MLDLVRITPKDCNFDPVAKNVVKKNGDKVELLKEDEKYFKNTLFSKANGDELWTLEIWSYLGPTSKSHRTPLYRTPSWSPEP